MNNSKKQIVIIMLLLLMQFAHAESPELNTSITEAKEYTGVDNFFEFTLVTNEKTGGIIGLFMILICAFVAFGVSLFFNNNFEKSGLIATFSATVFSVILRPTTLVTDNVFYISLLSLLAAIGISYASNK